MLKLLIVENDILLYKNLINTISSSISNIQIYNISSNELEALDILKNKKVDIIIIDLISLKISTSKILNYIKNHDLMCYLNSIITIHNNYNLSYSPYIYSNLTNLNMPSLLIRPLKDIIKIKEDFELKNKIAKELLYLGYNFAHIGTQQLLECIYLSLNNPCYINNLSKTIYPILSQKFFTTPNNIKCNIFQATNNSYFECEEIQLNKYFKKKLVCKPSTKDVILAVSKHINYS